MELNPVVETSFEELQSYLRIDYSITSHLGATDERRFIQHIYAEIILQYKDKREQLIGSVEALKLLAGIAVRHQTPLGNLLAVEGETSLFGEKIYDYQQADWNSKIKPLMAGTDKGSDILILDHVELIPAFRGKHIGYYAITDLYNHFIGGCRLFIASLDAYRIEQAQVVEKPKSMTRLVHFFEGIGFTMVPEISSDMMFMNPLADNPLLKKPQ